MKAAVRVICFATVLVCISARAEGEQFTEAVYAYLQQCVDAQGISAGIVVGLVDEQGSHVVSYGSPDNGSPAQVDGDTLFEIASLTKTFTGLLLEQMVARGEMKLDDPAQKYLPDSVRMPVRNGKQITLFELATHTSGLPRDPANLNPRRAVNPFADYTTGGLYAFLSGYSLKRDRGAGWEYSNLGVGLLGDLIALKAGESYESLVVDRICEPLGMRDTRITLTAEQRARRAVGHNRFGYAVPAGEFGELQGCGALHSTANDMLKYIAANLRLVSSPLTPLMQQTHEVRYRQASGLDMGLVWWNTNLNGEKIVWHGGDSGGFLSYMGLDKARRRGVLVLANSRADVVNIGQFLLASEWRAGRRPIESNITVGNYDSLVGEYQRLPDRAPGITRLRHLFFYVPPAAVDISAAICGAAILFLARKKIHLAKPWSIRGGIAVAGGLLAIRTVLVVSQGYGAPSQSGIEVRTEGDRIFARITGLRIWPLDVVLPPVTGELRPEAANVFYERLTGIPVLQFRNDLWGNVKNLVVDYGGHAFSYEKIASEPQRFSERLTPRTTIVLGEKQLDACTGVFEFEPSAMFPYGAKQKIWREGDSLVSQVWIKGVAQEAEEIYPESESKFFFESDDSELSFVKDKDGNATAIGRIAAGHADFVGRKISGD